jgi:hypothetical protein
MIIKRCTLTSGQSIICSKQSKSVQAHKANQEARERHKSNMSASNSNASSGPTATQPQPTPQGNFVFFLPPPPTVWVQFNDGMQVAFTPSPARYLQSVLSGVPLLGGMAGNGDANNGGDGFLYALNALFQRAQAQSHGPPPTSKPFLDKLPVKIWTQDMEKTESHTECVICLSDYEENDKVISLPCGHTFHKDCGMTWLVEHNVCPTCRYQLPKQQEATLAQATAQAATQTLVGGRGRPLREGRDGEAPDRRQRRECRD